MRSLAALILLAAGLLAGLALASRPPAAAQDGIPIPTPPVGYLGGRVQLTPAPGAPDADQTAPTPPGCPTTDEDANELLVRRWFDEVLSQGNLAGLDQLLDSGSVIHPATGADHVGVEGHRRYVEALRAGFPDLRVTIDEAVVKGNIVVARWTATGTHLGPYEGAAPTGLSATWPGLTFARITCGRIAQTWSEDDALGRLGQLGLLTPDDLADAATPLP